MEHEENQNVRLHLVMAVGNAALGDSRVEKAAITARDAGYKVTVLALQRPNTAPFWFIDGDIPVLRVKIGQQHYHPKLRQADRVIQAEGHHALNALSEQNHLVSSLSSQLHTQRGMKWGPSLALRRELKKAGRKLESLEKSVEQFVKSETEKALKRYPSDSKWAETWPEIADYRDAFYAGLTQLEPDLIHVHDIHPMAAAEAYCTDSAKRGKKVQWVYDAHEWLPGQDFYKRHPLRHLGWSKMERDLASKAASVLTVSEHMAHQLKERLGLSEVPGTVYNAPMLSQKDTTLAPRKPIREECGLESDVPLMVYVGGVNPRRGTLTMVDAVAHHPSLHAAFVANQDNASRRAIQNRAEVMGVSDRIHILDYVPADSVSAYIRSADVGVSALLPTASHHQAAPTKVREYMLAELPVVVSDMKVQSELISRLGVGEVFPAGDAMALAEAVDKCLVDKQKYIAGYTTEVLFDNSWEACVPALESAWIAASGVDVPQLPVMRSKPLVYIDICEDGPFRSLISEFKAISEFDFVFASPPFQCPVSTYKSEYFYSSPGVRAVLELWRSAFANLHGIISDQPYDFGNNWLVADINRSLRQFGARNIHLQTNGNADDYTYLSKSFPNHFVNDFSRSEFSYWRYLQREQRLGDLKSHRYFASPSPLTARSYRNQGLYAPYPIENFASKLPNRSDQKELKVGVLPSVRSSEDEAAVGEVLDFDGPEFSAVVIHSEVEPTTLSQFDIVIDSLGVDYPSYLGALAMAQGAAILTGRHASKRYPHQLRSLPSLRARPFEIMSRLREIEREEVDSYRSKSYEYATERYSPRNVANEILRLANQKSAETA